MGITFTTIITCNGCNKTLENNENFSSFLESPSGIAEKLFPEQIVVCDLNCFKTFATTISTGA